MVGKTRMDVRKNNNGWMENRMDPMKNMNRWKEKQKCVERKIRTDGRKNE